MKIARVVWLLLLFPMQVLASPTEPDDSEPKLTDFYALFSENTEVVTANKVATKSSEAPAVITVIPLSMIQARGYRNIGEALAEAPGFYVVQNRVTYAAGVRGIGYVADSFNQMIKFMINGQPTTLYSTGGALLGPEFIPIEAVKSIEVIRGPGSALYGANAYLGVVNIITQQVEQGAHLMFSGAIGDVASNLSSGGAVYGTYGLDSNQTATLLMAASTSQQDRSGISVRGHRSDLRGQVTESDTTHPVSAFVRGGWATPHLGAFTIQATYQRLNAFDEYSEYGPLTHDMHLATDNLFGRIEHQIEFLSSLQLHSFVGASRSQDLPEQEFRVAPDKTIHRIRNNSAWELGSELSWRAYGAYVLGGVDYLDNTFFGDTTYNEDGPSLQGTTVIPGNWRPVTVGFAHAYNNTGYYLHAAYVLFDALHISGGLRYDDNSLWTSRLNWRAAATYTATPDLHLKLLYGTSMVPPSLAMIYGVQMGMAVGSRVGSNSRLIGPQQAPESADTLEFSIEYSFEEYLRASVNVFWTRASGAFVLEPDSTYAVLSNTLGADVVGGEATIEGRYNRAFAQANVSLAYSAAQEIPSAPVWYQNLFGNRRAMGGMLPAYPNVLSQIGAGVSVPELYFEATAVAHIVGARNASINNTLYLGQSYAMPAYATADVNLRSLGLQIPDWGALDLSFRVTNLFNTLYQDPGNMGVDIPTVGRTLDMRLRVAI